MSSKNESHLTPPVIHQAMLNYIHLCICTIVAQWISDFPMHCLEDAYRLLPRLPSYLGGTWERISSKLPGDAHAAGVGTTVIIKRRVDFASGSQDWNCNSSSYWLTLKLAISNMIPTDSHKRFKCFLLKTKRSLHQ